LKKLLKFLALAAPLAYMALIWVLSSKPSDAVVDFGYAYDDFLKESLHLVEFAILFALLIIAFWALGKTSHRLQKLAAVIAIFYGLLDEIHQYFVPFRSATLIDFLKDTIGVLVVFYILRHYEKNEEVRLGRMIIKVKELLQGLSVK
jgi:VanZ family protein